ncbi:DUF937 domain-containing protein [Neptunicoccus cionae]|uniref:DUF937 domain-containing protein n=1 Tax=Neptunicoccus cionae TaxID=2035344 RepID=UPI00257006E5|nr:DUF937 domain-containing protein [Amylibacter cionae]
MSLMNLLQNAQNGQGLSQLASQFGMNESQAQQLSELLAPTIGQAAKEKAESGGMQDLLSSLHGEQQRSYFEDASQAAAPTGQAQGMAFLETLMGGHQAPKEIASEAAERTGIDLATVMQFLPALAAMLQGGLQKEMPDNTIENLMGRFSGADDSGGIMGMVGGFLGGGTDGKGPDLGHLSKLLDADGDGSPMNDILGKFMR